MAKVIIAAANPTTEEIEATNFIARTSSPSKQAASTMINNKLSSQAQWVCVNISKVIFTN